MKRASSQTKSFIILFVIAIVGSYLSFFTFKLVEKTPPRNNYLLTDQGSGDFSTIHYSPPPKTPVEEAPKPTPTPADISKWKTYTDKKFGFSFKYPQDWKILPPKMTDSFYTIEINPGKKLYNIKVSVSDKGFFAVDGLPMTQGTINGRSAVDVNDLLYGIKTNDYYYTFDIGWSLSLKPQFTALVRSASLPD